MAEFDRMRAKVLAMLASREWRAARKAEDPTMERHIPQLVRLNELGLLTFDSQAGRVGTSRTKSARTASGSCATG